MLVKITMEDEHSCSSQAMVEILAIAYAVLRVKQSTLNEHEIEAIDLIERLVPGMPGLYHRFVKESKHAV